MEKWKFFWLLTVSSNHRTLFRYSFVHIKAASSPEICDAKRRLRSAYVLIRISTRIKTKNKNASRIVRVKPFQPSDSRSISRLLTRSPLFSSPLLSPFLSFPLFPLLSSLLIAPWRRHVHVRCIDVLRYLVRRCEARIVGLSFRRA